MVLRHQIAFENIITFELYIYYISHGSMSPTRTPKHYNLYI